MALFENVFSAYSVLLITEREIFMKYSRLTLSSWYMVLCIIGVLMGTSSCISTTSDISTATPEVRKVELLPVGERPNIIPPRILKSEIPRGGILKIGYFSSTTSPDGFQAIGGFERMVFFISNEPLLSIGKDGAYDPPESLAYSFR